MVSRHRGLEIFWTTATTLVFAYLGIISLFTLYNVDTAPSGTITVKVVAHQFYFEFIYPNGTSVRTPSGELRVKAGEVVKLEVTSTDVIHSFSILELGVRVDAVPGRINNGWFIAEKPGRYAIVCFQFCGPLHYTMRGTLVVTA